jgi:hypothetical protein
MIIVFLTLAVPVFAAMALKYATIHEPSHPVGYTAEFFASRVKELTASSCMTPTAQGVTTPASTRARPDQSVHWMD